MAMTNDEVIRLLLQVTGAENLDDLKDRAKGAREKIDDLAGATGRAEKSTRNFGRATLESGRIIQDLAQGGIPGILNNIEGLSSALGGGPGLAGVLTALGVAAYFAVPAVKSMWSSIVDGSNGVPDATGRLDKLSEALGGVNDRLKELKDKGWLTDSELEEYNTKLGRRVELEKEITAEKEAQATYAKSEKATADAGLDKNAAAVAQKIVEDSGGIQEVLRRVSRTLLDREKGQFDSIEGERGAEDANHQARLRGLGPRTMMNEYRFIQEELKHDRRIKEFDERVANLRDSLAKEGNAALSGALKGDPEAARRMFELDPANAGRWNAATPGGLAYAARKKEAEELDKLDAQRRNKEADRQARIQAEAQKKDEEEQERAEKFLKGQRSSQEDRLSSYLQGADASNKAKAARDEAKAARDAEAAGREAERQAERDARAALPGNRLQAMRDQAYQTAAWIAMAENDGSFNPAQLQEIARRAADNVGSLDVASIRQAVYQSAAMTRAKIQRELDMNMRRLYQGGGYSYGME